MGIISTLKNNSEAGEDALNNLLAADLRAAVIAGTDRPQFIPTVVFRNADSLRNGTGYPEPRLSLLFAADTVEVIWQLQRRGAERWLAPVVTVRISTYITPVVVDIARRWALTFERLMEEGA